MQQLGKLKEIYNIRDIWKHEALDFTPWLAKDTNIALLSDAIGIDIEVEKTEVPVGSFFVDIVGKERNGDRRVIIENQLEETDHDHLGKIITYASGQEASVIVWVVRRAREEHRAAIEWLNANIGSNIAFFLCEIKLYQIDNSRPAVKFEIVEQPNNWSKISKGTAVESNIRKERLAYWEAFAEYVKNDTEYNSNLKLGRLSGDHWLNLYIGCSSCHISVLNIRKRKEVNIEVYISDDKAFYQRLYSHREDIEAIFGYKLNWQELPHKKASRIIYAVPYDTLDKEQWDEQFAWIREYTVRLYQAIKSYI